MRGFGRWMWLIGIAASITLAALELLKDIEKNRRENE
jgi:hypothetical protein